MSPEENQIIADFEKSAELYDRLGRQAEEAVKQIIADNGFFIMDVSRRTKSLESLTNKLKRKSGKYHELSDVTDLCGIRIVCYFADTVDALADKLRERFDIDEANSIDKRKMWEANQFGYLSLHYVCSFRPGEDMSGVKFEIQVRTVLQHAWAEIEHDLGYKSMFGTPQTVRRTFSRLAGLLEIADKEFMEVRDNSQSYCEEVKRKISEGDTDDVLLDYISLAEYIKNNKLFNTMLDDAAEFYKLDIEYIDPYMYVEQLDFLGIRTISDLIYMLRRNEDLAVKMIFDELKRYDLDITSTNMILKYFCRAELCSQGYSDDMIRRFVDISIDDAEKAQKVTQDIIEEMKVYRAGT